MEYKIYTCSALTRKIVALSFVLLLVLFIRAQSGKIYRLVLLQFSKYRVSNSLFRNK